MTELPGSMQRGYRPANDREPFGFRDGIAQPAIAGIAGSGVPTGEFILGYENHYRSIPPTPVAPAELDPHGILPPLDNPHHAASALRDFGRNGSYVVYRKLQQDVAGFWRFMRDEAIRVKGEADPAYMVWLAARFVGRWPSGAPLALFPDADDPRQGDRDDFRYGHDPRGFGCPMGAHVRRANPRDVIRPNPAQQSLSMSEAHRLLRRARVFGPPLFDPLLLREAKGTATGDALREIRDDGRARGIAFLLRQRQHPEPVRVRAADLVQQPALRRPARQQGSDRRRRRARRRDAEPDDDPRAADGSHRGVPAVRDGPGVRLLLHAGSDGAALPGECGNAGYAR